MATATAFEVFGFKATPTVLPTPTVKKYIANPDYITAQYEDVIMWDTANRAVMRTPRKDVKRQLDFMPNRYNRDQKGNWMEVPFYLEVDVESIEVPVKGCI